MFLVFNIVYVLKVGWRGMCCNRTHSYSVSSEYNNIFILLEA